MRQTVSRLARFVVLFLAFCPFTMGAEDGSSSFVGEFSNVRHTAEHAYGYSVMLWNDGDQLFGLFSAANGLAGDTPVGLLENVQLDSGDRQAVIYSEAQCCRSVSRPGKAGANT
jgi:hypothetical protein